MAARNVFTHLITPPPPSLGLTDKSERTKTRLHLFEDLTIRPLVRLPIDHNRLILAPLVLQKLLVLRLSGVKLDEVVAIIVGSDVKGRESLIATDEKGTSDDGVLVDTVNGGTPKDIFARGFEAVEESAWENLVSGAQRGCEDYDTPIKFALMKVMVSSSLYL